MCCHAGLRKGLRKAVKLPQMCPSTQVSSKHKYIYWPGHEHSKPLKHSKPKVRETDKVSLTAPQQNPNKIYKKRYIHKIFKKEALFIHLACAVEPPEASTFYFGIQSSPQSCEMCHSLQVICFEILKNRCHKGLSAFVCFVKKLWLQYQPFEHYTTQNCGYR